MRVVKFSDAIKERLVDAISKGASPRLAAQAAGITFRTFQRWRQYGEELASRIEDENPEIFEDQLSDDDLEYLSFYRTVSLAEAEVGLEIINSLQSVAKMRQDPRAFEFLISRLRPGEYGKETPEQIERPPVQHIIRIVADDSARQAMLTASREQREAPGIHISSVIDHDDGGAGTKPHDIDDIDADDDAIIDGELVPHAQLQAQHG